MSDIARKQSPFPELSASPEDASRIRPRGAEDEPRPRQESAPELSANRAAVEARSRPSARPARDSLDDRLERKMQQAGELARDLPLTDARVRLLHIAIMRRDETLLDGVLAELNKARSGRV